jgi:hypothetical protein
MESMRERTCLCGAADEDGVLFEIAVVGHGVLPLEPLLALPDLVVIVVPATRNLVRAPVRGEAVEGASPALDRLGVLGNVDATEERDLAEESDADEQREQQRATPPTACRLGLRVGALHG